MDGGFDFGGFPPADQATNGLPEKKKKKKKSKSNDPFDFSDPGRSGLGTLEDTAARPPSTSRRVSFSDEAMGRPIEEFEVAFGNGSSPNGFPGGLSGPGPEGYSSPSSGGPYAGGSSYAGSPSDRFEDSEFSGGGRGPALPLSAIDQALSRAAESRTFADSVVDRAGPLAAGEPARSPAVAAVAGTTGQDGLGALVQRHVGEERRFGEDFGGPRRVPRGFSFSLNDMPDSAVLAGESPYFVGAHPPSRDHLALPQKWNPLDGISRHWAETEREAIEVPSIGTAGKLGGSSGVLPGSLMKPGSLEEELQMAEQRVRALHTRLFELESGVSASTSSAQGHLKITVPQPLDGGKLGVAVKDMTVASIVDARALQHGWRIGDRILQVNGFPVCYMHEFAGELNKALAANRTASRPLVFDIWRQTALPGPAQPASAPLPTAGHADGLGVAAPSGSEVRQQEAPPAAAATARAQPVRRRTVCGESAGSDSETQGQQHHTTVASALARTLPPTLSARDGGVPCAVPLPVALPAPVELQQTVPPAPTPGAAPARSWQAAAAERPAAALAATPALLAGVAAGGTVARAPAPVLAAEAAPMARLPGPPATAPARGSAYPPPGFALDRMLPSTATTLPMSGQGVPLANGHSGHTAMATMPAGSSTVALSRRRRLVC
mmetsp:Transcript_59970/g.188329  ORF Transcript_59970/g.188329 Transcript_59970/m.188329 type:complete len:665 (-) Transcript_59970:91-2085(-)